MVWAEFVMTSSPHQRNNINMLGILKECEAAMLEESGENNAIQSLCDVK